MFIHLKRAKDQVTIYVLPHRIESIERAWVGEGSTVEMMSGASHWVEEPPDKVAYLVGFFKLDK